MLVLFGTSKKSADFMRICWILFRMLSSDALKWGSQGSSSYMYVGICATLKRKKSCTWTAGKPRHLSWKNTTKYGQQSYHRNKFLNRFKLFFLHIISEWRRNVFTGTRLRRARQINNPASLASKSDPEIAQALSRNQWIWGIFGVRRRAGKCV